MTWNEFKELAELKLKGRNPEMMYIDTDIFPEVEKLKIDIVRNELTIDY